MFEQAPSIVFAPDVPPMKPPNDFYMQSEKISLGEEDLSNTKEISVSLTDFGTSSWFDNHLTEWIQPQILKAPEVILGMKWDYKVDIWNLGLIVSSQESLASWNSEYIPIERKVWELAEGQYLFDGCATDSSEYTADAHLSQMEAVLGVFPKSILKRGGNVERYSNDDGYLLRPTSFPTFSLEKFSNIPEITGTEREDFLDLIGSMVRLLPEERPNTGELLEAKWLRDDNNSVII